MRPIKTAIAAGVVLFALAAGAQAQLADFWPAPFTPNWDFEAQPLKGDVREMQFGRENELPGGGKKFSAFKIFRFKPLPGGGREATEGAAGRPRTVITYDDKGRRVRVVSHYVMGDGPGGRGMKSVTAVETATYDARGHLSAIEIKKNDDPAQTIRFTETPRPDGGRAVSWKYTEGTGEMAHERVAEMVYDARGRVVSWSDERADAKPPRRAYILTYNDHGDVSTTGYDAVDTRYEYKYDDVGNWIWRQRIVPSSDKVIQEVELRKFVYGGPPAAAARPVAPATRPAATTPGPILATRPALARAAAAGVAPTVGRYRSESGKAGSGSYVEMAFTLKPDGTVDYTIATEFRDQRSNKAATGSWTARGVTVTVRLEKSSDGQPIPESARTTLRLRKTAGGGLASETDPKTVFRRAD